MQNKWILVGIALLAVVGAELLILAKVSLWVTIGLAGAGLAFVIFSNWKAGSAG